MSENNQTHSILPSKTDVINAFNGFIAGAVGGVAGIVIGHPLDTIRIRLQCQPPPKPGLPPLYSSFTDCFMKTFKREGLLGLYKGLLSPMLGEMVNCCLLFGCYGILNQLMTSDDIWTIGNKGMIAGLASTLVLSPVELIKIRLQLDTDPKRGTIGRQGFMDCVRHTVRQPGGIRNLFQGYSTTVLREVPFSWIYFVSYEYGKQLYAKHQNLPTHEIPAHVLACSGFVAGILAWTISYPTDVIKTNIQGTTEKVSLINMTKRIYKQQGIKGFYKGLWPTIVRAGPVNAAVFAFYEIVLRLLHRLHQYELIPK